VGPTVGPSFAGRISGVALSPDASRVAMVVTTVEGDALHVLDVTRGMTSPIKGDFNAPAWTPDGRDVFYVNPTTGEPYRRPSDGGGEARRIMNRPAFMPDVSLDGRYLVFYGLESATQRDVFAAALDKPTDVLSVVKSPANDVNPAISPDGAWLAYQSDQAGRWEVYLTRFPSGEGRTQVSVNGGRNPRWSRNGRELFFAVGDDIVSTPVTLGTTVSVGTPVVVVRGSMVNTELSPPGILEKSWDVNADGTRFVVAKGYGKGTSDVVVVENAFPRKR
jgi:Tol biopolymer transport system component